MDKNKDELKFLVKETSRNDLFCYFTFQTIDVHGEGMENMKSLKSHIKFVNGYLKDIFALKISNGIVIVKGLVCMIDTHK